MFRKKSLGGYIEEIYTVNVNPKLYEIDPQDS